jgi:hypothetical protein
MTKRIKAKSAPEALIAAGNAYPIQIPALPLPKPNTEVLPKVCYDTALLYITQEAQPESVGVAKAWLLEFLIRSQGWSPEKITAFFASREDQLVPLFHSPPPDVRVAWKLFQAGLFKWPNPFVTAYTHPPGVPDWGGFLLAELANWYSFFTPWYLTVSSIEIPSTDRRRRPEQIKNLQKKESPDEKLA